jgi:hypothetical protein
MPDGPPPKCPHCQVEFRAEDVAGRKTCPVCGGQLADPGPPSAALGCVVIIVFILLLYFAVKWILFEDNQPKRSSSNNLRTVTDALFDGGFCKTKIGFFAPTEKSVLELRSIFLSQDYEAKVKSIQKPGTDIMQPDLSVYVVDTNLPAVKIRLKGKNTTAWTLDLFLDCDINPNKTP